MAINSNWLDPVAGIGRATDVVNITLDQAASALNKYASTKIQETVRAADWEKFPGDLTSEQSRHYIKISAYLATTGTQQFTAYLFIPGAAPGEQMPLIYEHQHNFADIRLTNIINDSLIGVTYSMLTKRSINPAVQVLYRSTNLRQFDFSFLMVPRNEKESAAIEKITKNIRAYSSPEFKGGTVIAPAEFQIEVCSGTSGQNVHIPKIEKCVLTKVQVNWGPTGTFTSFRNNYPSACLLTFSATEIRLLDRNMILDQGF
jgi:hypothetical protein